MRANALLIGGIVALAASLGVTLAFGFPFYGLVVALPILILLGLIRILPPRLAPVEPLAQLDRPVIANQLWWILGVVVALTLVAIPRSYLIHLHPVLLFPQQSYGAVFSWQHVFASLGLTLLPGIYLAYRFRADGAQLGLRVSGAWRWIGPLIVTALFASLLGVEAFGSGRGSMPGSGMIAVAVALAVVTAAIPEELMYRVLLQTRLEAITGRWNAIAATSLLFGLIHAPQTFFLTSAGHIYDWPAAALYAIAVSILNQGLDGVLLGYVWARYRNFWAQVAMHGTADILIFVAIFGGFTPSN